MNSSERQIEPADHDILVNRDGIGKKLQRAIKYRINYYDDNCDDEW